MKCAVCGYENPDDASVCLNCGSDIVREKMGQAIDDISGEATVMIGMPTRPTIPSGDLPRQAPEPPKAAAPPPPPPPPPAPRPQPAPMAAPPPPPPPPRAPSPAAAQGSAGRPAAPPPPPPPPGGGMSPMAPMSNLGGASGYNALCIVSLVLGILSYPLLCCWGLGLLTGIGAAVTGFLGRKQAMERGEQGDALGLAGMICGAVAVVLTIVFIILNFVLGFAMPMIANSGQ